MPDWEIVVACLVGIALIVLAGRLRQRSLERRRSPATAERRRAAGADPRLSPVQEAQGAPMDPDSGEGRRST